MRGGGVKRGTTTALLRAVVALAATAALVCGVPLMLVRFVGNPLPSEVPTVDEIRILLTQNGDGFTEFVMGTLAVFVWVLWAQLMIALVVEVVATARSTGTPHLPVLPGIQQVAARLVAPIMLTATLAGGPVVAPAIGALTFAEAPKVEVLHDMSSTSMSAGVTEPGPIDLTPRPAESSGTATSRMLVEPSAGQPTTATTTLTVAEDIELWDLAEAAYGDGLSWKQIASANAGRIDARGAVITVETEAVPAGTRLRLAEPVGSDIATHGTLVSDDTEDNVTEDDVTEDNDTVTAQPPTRLHIVAPGESMWSIAESEIESRLERAPSTDEVMTYWADVVAANQDIPSGDVDLIHPGDALRMPGAPVMAIDVPEVAEPSPDGSVQSSLHPDVTTAGGGGIDTAETTPVPSEAEAAGAASAAGVFGVRDGPSVDSTIRESPAADDPAISIQSGGTDGEFPIAELPEQEADETPPTPETPVADTADHAGRVSIPAVGMAAMGAAILSAGVVGAVRRRRDLQRRTRPAGTIGRAPTSASAAFEAAMLHASDQVVESQTGLGWRMLPAAAVGVLRSNGPLEFRLGTDGRLAMVPVVDDSVDADDLGRPGAPRVEVDPTNGEKTSAEVASALAEMCGIEALPDDDDTEPGDAVVPATIVVGTDPTTGEAVLLDLASVGMLDVRGRREAVRRFTRGVVLDLAVSDRCDDLCIVAVGIADELHDLERVSAVVDLNEAVEVVRHSAHAGDSATPIVVVVVGAEADSEQHSDDIEQLRELGAFVVAADLETLAAPNAIVLDGDTATILPSGTTATVAAFDDDDYRSVAELIDTSKSTAIELVDPDRPLEHILDIAPTATCDIEPGPIEVQVLGPVTVAGADSFSSIKAVDVIAYLAFHRHGVDADQIKTWVWPAFDPPTDKAFANVMSRARGALGTNDEGMPFLSRAGADKTYRLSDTVTTDFDRFRAIVERADNAESDAATLGLLRQAIELIRGVPFTGGAASSFVWADNHVRARVEYTIDEAVHRCADLAIELGDLTTARWAVLKGLELVPGCEQCFRRRFLIAGADKNRSELRRAMADLESSAAVDLGEPEAVDTISGELLDLYNRLDRALVAGAAAGA